MAIDINDLHGLVSGKKGYTSVKNVSASSIQVSKDGNVVFPRVTHEKATDRVIIGDGSGVAVGDATAWLNSLK